MSATAYCRERHLGAMGMVSGEAVGAVVHDWGPTMISVVTYAVATFAWWGAQKATRAVTDDTLRTLLEWRKVHDEEAKQRDMGIAELRAIAAAMKATADAQGGQLGLMQQELRDYRIRTEIVRRQRA